MDTQSLPIRKHAEEIVEAIKINDVVVVIGETGSGKTTQLSQILLESGFCDSGLIGVTQPRRVGAVSVAKRVAEERGCELGCEVGYAVRFEDRSSSTTKIKYLTDGTLLRECLEDPSLSKYSVLVLDEAHERSLNTDILFGVLKQLMRKRAGALKLVVTSATLDGEKFSAYFGDCPVFTVPGRCYPVDIVHSTEDMMKTYAAAAIDTALQIHMHQPPGDILMFLTGQAEIDKAVAQLNAEISNLPEGTCGPLLVLPLYASLPPDMQSRIFRPPPEGTRRCIVATNVAETSITVDGVVYVIDSGVVKQKSYNPATGMDSLDVLSISRVQATQRAGRAGRTRPGKCFRLYTKAFFDRQMPNITLPEIQRTSLVGAVLYLKALDLDIDVLAFDFLDPPGRPSLEDALRQLYVLDAIDIDGKITDMGKSMSLLPLDPSLARALLAASSLGCVPEMVTVCAMLSVDRVFISEQPDKKGSGDKSIVKVLAAEGMGDHVLLLRLWELWEKNGCSRDFAKLAGLDLRGMNFARDIRRQLEAIVGEDGRGLRMRAEDHERTVVTESHSNGHGNGGSGRMNERPSLGRKRGREEEGQEGGHSGKHRRRSHNGPSSDKERIDALRHALTIGFANRLARRLRAHNGYRTMNTAGQLASLHPSTSTIQEDEEGLTAEWVVYHELVNTSRAFLRHVCPVEGRWVDEVVHKLTGVDVQRLARGHLPAEEAARSQGGADGTGLVSGSGKTAPKPSVAAEKRNTSDAVDAARLRYLQRKQQAVKK